MGRPIVRDISKENTDICPEDGSSIFCMYMYACMYCVCVCVCMYACMYVITMCNVQLNYC